ncbi:MAG: DUF3086 domain-containing protein [Snowella sp.]|nr:DUF3086 domain-containing protein [Snowella sp.]
MNSDAPLNPENVLTDETTEASTDSSMVDSPENLSNVEFSDMNAMPSPEPSVEPIPLEIPAVNILQSESSESTETAVNLDNSEIKELEQQKLTLQQEIADLQSQKSQLLNEQVIETQSAIEHLVQEGVRELEQRKQSLETAVEQLERRRERIRKEMQTTFAGVSQDLAMRVQGFKDYLVGSLQDLVAAAEQLELSSGDPWNASQEAASPIPISVSDTPKANFAAQSFEEQRRQIQRTLEQYRTRPDYYGPPWQLRRTFEPIHAERVQNWFFSQGGRGVIITMGSRLQNILVGSSIISVFHQLYGDRSRALILANTPERLGEWRRGLQDCLGISRADFGPDRGVVLFESPEALIQKAERLVEEKQMPFVIIDETEDQVNLALLQFPLWLAFAPNPQQPSSNYFY